MSVAQGGYFHRPESQRRRSLPGAAVAAGSPVAMPPHGAGSATRPSAAATGHQTLPPRARSTPQSSPETLGLANGHAKPLLPHAGTAFSGKLQVVLGNHSLWLQFHRRQNEMILTKPGRAMFPLLAYTIHGLDPKAHYHVFLDLLPTDPHHWRYEEEKWVRYAKEDQEETANPFYAHPHSPNTGAHWMKQEISFKKLRLTNSPTTAKNAAQAILLKSLRKYQPRLHIQEVRHGNQEPLAASSSFSHIFTFPETEFIAVTAYHNLEITRLKVNHNPYASAFRKGCQSLQSFLEGPPVAGASASPSPEALSVDSSYPAGAKEVAAPNRGESWATPRHSIHRPQAPLRQADHSAPGSMLAFGLDARNAAFLPETSPAAVPGDPGRSAVVSPGQGSASLPDTSQGYRMDRLPSQAPKAMTACSAAQRGESPQEQIWTYVGQSDWTISVGVGQERAWKKTCLSPPDTGRDAMCSVREVSQEQDCRLAVGEGSANPCPEAASEDSSYLAGLQEGAGQDKEMGSPVPWYDTEGPQPPWQRVDDSRASSNSTPGTPDVENPGFLLGPSAPAMPGDAGQGAVHSGGQGPTCLPQTFQGQRMDGLLSLPQKPTASVPGAQEEESLQEQIWTYLSQSDANPSVGLVDERPAKKTCLSPPDTGTDATCSAREVRQVQDDRLAVGEGSAHTRPEAAWEDSSYLAGLQEGAGQDKEQGYPVAWYGIRGPQPSLQHPCDTPLSSCSTTSHQPSTMLPFDHDALVAGLLPSTSLFAPLSDPALDGLVSLWESAPSLSGIPEGKHMDSLHSLSPKPGHPITGAQGEESRQEDISSSPTQSESDDSAAGPKAPKKRRLSANHSSGHHSSFSSLDCLSEFLF